MGKKGQVLVEFLIVLSIILLILLVIIGTSYQSSSQIGKVVANSQTKAFLDSLENSADSVYGQGVNAKTKIYIVVPDNVKNITFSSKSLIIGLQNGERIGRNFNYNISGSLSGNGGDYVSIESKANYVNISKV